MNDGIITAVYQLRKNNVPIKRIAKDLQIGVGTVYKILEKVAWKEKDTVHEVLSIENNCRRSMCIKYLKLNGIFIEKWTPNIKSSGLILSF